LQVSPIDGNRNLNAATHAVNGYAFGGGFMPQPVRAHGFPRSARILQHAEFELVYKLGKRHFGPHMTVFYLLRESGEGMRIGFTVSKKLGGAVDRNRMRRRLREAVRLHGLPAEIKADVVMNPKRSSLTAQFDEIQAAVRKAFEVVARAASQNAAKGVAKKESVS
jgi:ribonuclease P protein component